MNSGLVFGCKLRFKVKMMLVKTRISSQLYTRYCADNPYLNLVVISLSYKLYLNPGSLYEGEQAMSLSYKALVPYKLK